MTGPRGRRDVRGRTGAFLRRRVADAALVLAWVVVLFQVVQLAQVQGDTTTRRLVSMGLVLLLGVAVSVLWWRSRRPRG